MVVVVAQVLVYKVEQHRMLQVAQARPVQVIMDKMGKLIPATAVVAVVVAVAGTEWALVVVAVAMVVPVAGEIPLVRLAPTV